MPNGLNTDNQAFVSKTNFRLALLLCSEAVHSDWLKTGPMTWNDQSELFMNSTQGQLTLGIEPQFDVVPLHATLPARVDGIDKLEL